MSELSRLLDRNSTMPLNWRSMTKSEQEEWLMGHTDFDDPQMWREHKYVGGPPPPRIKKMQLAHETRARKACVRWDIVDLRIVYRQANGICGVCGEPVSLETFTIDHKKPICLGGSHTLENLQIAHSACNSSKGRRWA